MEKSRSLARRLSKELESMQRIMTCMIEKGYDPVEAKLITEESERVKSFWTVENLAETMSSIHTGQGIATSINTITLSGMPTAIGATGGSSSWTMGATGIMGAIGAAGANGAAAPYSISHKYSQSSSTSV